MNPPSFDWLADFIVGWLVGRSVGWSIGFSVKAKKLHFNFPIKGLVQ